MIYYIMMGRIGIENSEITLSLKIHSEKEGREKVFAVPSER